MTQHHNRGSDRGVTLEDDMKKNKHKSKVTITNLIIITANLFIKNKNLKNIKPQKE
jgi:hypothetical protein